MYTLSSTTSRNREEARIKSKGESFGGIGKANGSIKSGDN